jgi:UDP-N-acetylglucosamine 1-carboxyvinyltransferase
LITATRSCIPCGRRVQLAIVPAPSTLVNSSHPNQQRRAIHRRRRTPLSGTIRPAGNKNAALPIVAATLLTEHPVTLENVPRIRDIETLVELIASLGAEIAWTARNTLRVHARTITPGELDREKSKKIRGSILLAGPVLARCGRITIPPPGGDVIGRRRLDTHFLALEQLGATYDVSDVLDFQAKALRGADVFLDEPSVTGTENAIMAAVLAKGTTVLRNAASEPHVQDLCRFLVALGARIEGIGTNTVTIAGDAALGGATYAIGPDQHRGRQLHRAGGGHRSELRIADAGVEHLRSTLMGFERPRHQLPRGRLGPRVPAEQSRTIQSDLGGHVPTLSDQPWPAFPADVMSIAIVTAHAVRGYGAHAREDVRVAHVLCRQAHRHGRSHRALRPASGDRVRADAASRRDGGVAGHPRRDGDGARGALRAGAEHDQQRRADRARLRAHRRATDCARRPHRAP